MAQQPSAAVVICRPMPEDLIWVVREMLSNNREPLGLPGQIFIDYKKRVELLCVHCPSGAEAGKIEIFLRQVLDRLQDLAQAQATVGDPAWMQLASSTVVLQRAKNCEICHLTHPADEMPLVVCWSSKPHADPASPPAAGRAAEAVGAAARPNSRADAGEEDSSDDGGADEGSEGSSALLSPSAAAAVVANATEAGLRLTMLQLRGTAAALVPRGEARATRDRFAARLPPGAKCELLPPEPLWLRDRPSGARWVAQGRALMLCMQRLGAIPWDTVDHTLHYLARAVVPEEVMTDLPCAMLRGWKLHYSASYADHTQLPQIRNPQYRYTLLGARHASSQVLHVAACGETSEIFSPDKEVPDYSPGEPAEAKPHRGVFWYCNPDKACGFSPDKTVCLHYADTSWTPWARHRTLNTADPKVMQERGGKRLSWNLNPPGWSTGGWRAGAHCELGSRPGGWRKVVYCSNQPLFCCADTEGGW